VLAGMTAILAKQFVEPLNLTWQAYGFEIVMFLDKSARVGAKGFSFLMFLSSSYVSVAKFSGSKN